MNRSLQQTVDDLIEHVDRVISGRLSRKQDQSLYRLNRKVDRLDRMLTLLLIAQSIEDDNEETIMSAVDDLTAQVEALEVGQNAASQAVSDAAQRVSASLDALRAQIQTLEAEENPDLSGLTSRVAQAASAAQQLVFAAASIDPSTGEPEPPTENPDDQPHPDQTLPGDLPPDQA